MQAIHQYLVITPHLLVFQFIDSMMFLYFELVTSYSATLY
jgi:hypothetical protein